MKKIVTVVLLLFFVFVSKAQTNFFTDKPEKSFRQQQIKAIVKPEKYRTVFLDTLALIRFLKAVPLEKDLVERINAPVIILPMPDGKSAKFYIWESQTMDPALAAKFPEIKTYTGQGVDDKSATVSIDWTPLGFHAMILTGTANTIFIDPYSKGSKTNYISYFKKDFKKKEAFQELLPKKLTEKANRPITGETVLGSVGTQLRTYDLAIACTHEYAIAVCDPLTPTIPLTLAAITTTVSRMNQIYEKELSIHFNLVAAESSIIFVTAGTDPFTGNNDPSILLDESQSVINSNIGSVNYDIGHTFSTGAGGYASVGVVCVNGHKAEGCTGTADPVGDPFVIDYVCHEIGHQFNADHSFNSNLDLCGAQGQWSATTNAEPGSGSTIMGYSASPVLCSSDNLQDNSDAQFHAVSFEQIVAYSVNGTANACATKTTTGNSLPVVNAGADYIIPKSTPFILSGTATDNDINDQLTYCWEQIDVGAPASTWNSPSGIHAPLFRSFPPVDSAKRYFPKYNDVLNNTTTKGELLPAIARTMNFRLTVRDNRTGGGGVNSDDMAVTVNGNGPFQVTYPTSAGINWNGNQSQTITWDVANTNLSPINTANVMIQLSTDGGITFPITLLATTANDGSEVIVVPNVTTSSARIRIMAVGNIYYDISNNNFNIVFTPPVFWVDLSVEKTNENTSSLHWTVNETNTDFYEIQRGSDGISFTKIGNIDATDLPNTVQQYNFVDSFPLAGINFYRIRKIDTNGLDGFSSTVSDTFAIVHKSWSIYPNPTAGEMKIKSNISTGKTFYQIFDATGKLLFKKSVATVQIGAIETLDFSKYPSGVYLLKITTEAAVTIEKVIVRNM
ncbi:reprolysin-like metallopeptidase [Ferruginibacter sp. SUN002]|uniref:zinc-dependent metalloprotease n=1 Tax=Ferruginibacter sp. SUN002 TaxID=2937789 RepID=UPI003D35B8CC